MAKVTVCIAARNEPDIYSLIETILGLGYSVVVVDDASVERIYPQEHRHFYVLRNEERRGIAASLMRAWAWALENGADYILQMDAGGSHDPEQLAQLVDAPKSGNDMVIGSRFMPGGEYIGNPRRKAMSRIAAAACNWACPSHHHTDWTSGFRGFRREAVQALLRHPYYAAMHGWQIEVLRRAHQDGVKIAEVSITYTAGKSFFNWRAAAEAFVVWLDLLFL